MRLVQYFQHFVCTPRLRLRSEVACTVVEQSHSSGMRNFVLDRIQEDCKRIRYISNENAVQFHIP